MILLAHVLAWAAIALGAPLLILTVVFLIQVFASAMRSKRAELKGTASVAGPTVVLVPAHNEAGGIEHTLRTLQPQLRLDDRVLVVADNCSDGTAELARACGAEVVERFDATERGKGYALAFGVAHLRSNPPAVVVILDADCELGDGSLAALASELERTGRPVQALYLMLAQADAGLSRRLAQFAWRVRNWVRPAGWHRLGLPCQLMGTGMAFGWEMLRDAPLANASIVEDMKLGIDLAMTGRAPIFCEGALVTSHFPDSNVASSKQRTRWEHGHLEMILREVPRMLGRALPRVDLRLFGMAFDLAVPPLALLAGLLCIDWILAVAVLALGGGGFALVGASALMATFVLGVLTAWVLRGRDLVRFTELLSVPWYVAAKIPLYTRFITRRQRDWVRTDRK